MATVTRKQREIRDREGRILEVARRMLIERGYLGLTMDRIAEALEYSKGTIYQHFPNKEEVLAELALETARLRAAWFERAATFRGRPRERFAAIGQAAVLFLLLRPDHFHSERIIRASSFRDKVSPARQRELESCSTRCMGSATGIVRDGIAHGDLALPAAVPPELVTFGCWTLLEGTSLLMSSDISDFALRVDDPIAALRLNWERLLDGYGWRPLAAELDYDATIARIHREVFPAEAKAVGDRPAWHLHGDGEA